MSPWIETAKVLGPIISPFIALIGAVYLYFRKQRSDREDARRKEKLELYAESLELAGKARKSVLARRVPDNIDTEVSGFLVSTFKIRIVGSENVYEAALALAKALNDLGQATLFAALAATKEIRKNGEPRSHDFLINEATKAEVHLIETMRADIESYAPPKKARRN